MKFINDNPHRKFREISGRLWVYGYANICDSVLLSLLDNEKDFSHIRGQFAFVYITKKRWVGCVDHLATTQLFYSHDIISPSLRDVKNNCKITINEFTRNIRKFMGEYVPGIQTPYNEIFRVEHEHYVEKSLNYYGEQQQYVDICNENVQQLDIDYAYEILCNASNREKDHTLLFSGGKDSAFLGMLSKHLGHQSRMVHMSSLQNRKHTVDDEECKLFKEEKRWRILRFPVEHSGPQNAEDMDMYCRKDWWHDNTHPLKSLCGQNWDNIKVTGEISTAEQQRGTYSNFFVNKFDKITAEDVVNIHLRGCYTNNNKTIPFSMSTQIFDDYKKEHPQEFEFLFNYFMDKINSIDKHPLYAYYIFRNPIVSSHRLYGQSQDPNTSWFSPFADYDVYNLMLNLDWKWKEGEGIQKKQLYDIAKAKFGKDFSDIPWRFPIMGMGISV